MNITALAKQLTHQDCKSTKSVLLNCTAFRRENSMLLFGCFWTAHDLGMNDLSRQRLTDLLSPAILCRWEWARKAGKWLRRICISSVSWTQACGWKGWLRQKLVLIFWIWCELDFVHGTWKLGIWACLCLHFYKFPTLPAFSEELLQNMQWLLGATPSSSCCAFWHSVLTVTAEKQAFHLQFVSICVCVCLLMGLLYLAHCKQRWDDKWMTMRKQKAPTLRLCGIIFLGNSIEWYRHHLRFYSFEECCSFILVQLKGPVVVQQLACLRKNGAARWIPGKSLFSDLLNA